MSNTETLIKPKRPIEIGWTQLQSFNTYGFEALAFRHNETGILVSSAVEVVNDDGQENVGPEYHLGISKNGGRCSADEALWVLKQFDLEGAEEDNHSGVVRSFWRPVADKYVGIVCPCKEDEAVIREGDYEWRPLK